MLAGFLISCFISFTSKIIYRLPRLFFLPYSFMRIILCILFVLSVFPVLSQSTLQGTQSVIDQVEQMGLKNQDKEAIELIDQALKNPANGPDDFIYLYSYKSGIALENDSLKLGNELVDLCLDYAKQTSRPLSKVMALRAKAYLNSYLNLTDQVIKDSKEALKILEEEKEAYNLKYYFNYLIYATYSGWDESDKMLHYIKECEKFAKLSENPNNIAKVHLGYASVYLNQYRKNNQKNDLDSNSYHLNKAYQIFEQHPSEVSSNTFVVACVNLANYQLEFANAPIQDRKAIAFKFLDSAEVELKNDRARFSRWINIYGIRSDFALKEGNVQLAEQYLIEAIGRLDSRKDNSLLRLEFSLYKHLADLSEKKGDINSALNYQKKAEAVLKQNFDQQQITNAQKLEIQYETEKKDQQLKLLGETAELRKNQNYLYGGLAVLAMLGLAFMFRAYHFKLRYSIEREKKLAKEKEDAELNAEMRLKLEIEEQARLKAEQELLELKHQQLQKEALANSLIIEHKNDMLKQIQSKLKDGDPRDIQKLLKEETLLNADFEDIKWQLQQLHPNFFSQLIEKSNQKLTALDLKYCAYIYLQMSTKQIAQVLHVEAQSVRMFKYRLKQKFGLSKESDLESFLQEVGS